MLLYCAGAQVHVIFKLLLDIGVGDDGDYGRVKNALDVQFTVTPNIPYQQHMFRKSMQMPGESVAQYCTRLWVLSTYCGYTDLDIEISDQVVTGCSEDTLHSKFSEKVRI